MERRPFDKSVEAESVSPAEEFDHAEVCRVLCCKCSEYVLACECEWELLDGATVIICDLTKAPELNGAPEVGHSIGKWGGQEGEA